MASPIRVRAANDRPVQTDGQYVLYWMTAARRTAHSFALDHAIDHAKRLRQPLIVLEALRSGYHWASDRMHGFVLAGMADQRAAFQAVEGIAYYAYVEPEHGAGSGLIEELAKRASLVVADDYPCFFLPRMLAATAARLDVLVEAVDGNGLLPMRAADRAFTRAFDFRRYLQKNLAPHLEDLPRAKPLARLSLPLAELDPAWLERWPEATDELLALAPDALAALPIDHSVSVVAEEPGGSAAGRRQLDSFIKDGLSRYDDDRNHPDRDGQSNLSAYLHFGQVGAHEIFAALAKATNWTTDRLGAMTSGKREGYWEMSPAADAFLEELVTWRELGFNFCSRRDDYDQFESLPDWAQKSLTLHAGDLRPELYSLDQLAAAETGDEIWNAAQTQLVTEGRIHNYLRMLWGKKILEWTPSPQDALAVMIELNNRYALDGRDPNSYSGIFWVLGRFDRAWGPERPIYGKVRYMTSDSTRRKLRLKSYLATYRAGPKRGADQQELFQ